MIPFAAKTAAETVNAFHWARHPPKLALPLGHLDPRLIHSMGPPESTPKRHLNQFRRFRRAQEHDQQTDRQTTLLRLYQLVAVASCPCDAA